MQVLVDHDANLDSQTKSGDTPLLLSAKEAESEVHMHCVQVVNPAGAPPRLAAGHALFLHTPSDEFGSSLRC